MADMSIVYQVERYVQLDPEFDLTALEKATQVALDAPAFYEGEPADKLRYLIYAYQDITGRGLYTLRERPAKSEEI